MTIVKLTAHQAIFGEKKGGHSLICSSLSERNLPRELTNYTDRPSGNLPPNLRWEPYISGYLLESYYVISKTFPDLEASRPGMVLTHAILLNIEDLSYLDNLQDVFQFLTSQPEKHSAVSTLEITLSSAQNQSPPPGTSKLVNSLLDESQQSKPVIWVGQDGFVEVIQILWLNLWPEVRKTLTFRLSFSPQDIEDQQFTLVSTPEVQKSRWSGYTLVQKSDLHEPKTKAEAFLLGLSDGEPLRKMYQDLKISSSDISTIRELERCYDYLQTIGKNDTTNGIRQLVRTFGKLSPVPENGDQLKQRALLRLCELTRTGNSKDIEALANLDPTPFVNGADLLRKTIVSWCKEHFQPETFETSEQLADLVTLSFSSNFFEWNNAVHTALEETLSVWKPNTGSLIWEWWQSKNELVDLLAPFIPVQAKIEREFVKYSPPQLPNELGVKIQEFSKKRQWYILHAVTVTTFCEPHIAIQKQLEIDKQLTHYDGLRELVRRIPGKPLVQVALDKGEARLLKLAGEICAKKPELFADLDATKRNWRKIWLFAIQIGLKPWANISGPNAVMYSLIDLLLKGETIDDDLLICLAETPYGDLTDYPRREEVWSRMKPEIAEKYLDATADGWLDKFRQWGIFEDAVEEPLETVILDSSRLQRKIYQVSNDTASITIRLFKYFPKLTETQFNSLFLTKYLNSNKYIDRVDALQIGQVIAQKRWRSTASRLYSCKNRTDLMPALRECKHLLSIFEQFMLNWFGGSSNSYVNSDDWWKAFTETIIELYPHGPKEQEIWSRAGGDISVINMSSPGRTSWEDALRRLRHGGGGQEIDVYRFIEEIKKDYSNNTKIVELEKLFEKL